VAITFVQSAKKIAATTDAANFSGCNATGLFVVIIGGFDVATLSDSSSNTWTAGTTFTDAGSGGFTKMYYVVNPTATSSHTFSFSGSFYSIVVFGFANVSAFDQATGANGDVDQPGSLTPGTDGTSLFVTGVGGNRTGQSINSPFSGTVVQNDYAAGVNYGSAGAYYIQSSAGAQNPTWSDSSGTSGCAMMTFTPAAGGAGDTQEWRGSYPPIRNNRQVNVMFRHAHYLAT
jgi:hypothetical protein